MMKDDIYLVAKKIGDYWQNIITKGRGSYSIYNKPSREVGFIERYEANQIQALKKEVRYFTETDLYAKLKPNHKHDTWGKGVCKKR